MEKRKIRRIGIVGSDPRGIVNEIMESGILDAVSLPIVTCKLTDDLSYSDLMDFIGQYALDMVIVSNRVEKDDAFWKKIWSKLKNRCMVVRQEI